MDVPRRFLPTSPDRSRRRFGLRAPDLGRITVSGASALRIAAVNSGVLAALNVTLHGRWPIRQQAGPANDHVKWNGANGWSVVMKRTIAEGLSVTVIAIAVLAFLDA